MLLPLSLMLALCGLGAYLWALRGKQFDDLETPALRALFDDRVAPPRESTLRVDSLHETEAPILPVNPPRR